MASVEQCGAEHRDTGAGRALLPGGEGRAGQEQAGIATQWLPPKFITHRTADTDETQIFVAQLQGTSVSN